jgi:hypothetical protein
MTGVEVDRGSAPIPNLSLFEMPSLFILASKVVLATPILAAAPLVPAITHPTDSKISTISARSESRNLPEKDVTDRTSALRRGL